MRVYVAGPLTSPDPDRQLDNVHAAMAVSRDLLDLGHEPYLPHTTHFFDQLHPMTYEAYMRWHGAFLDVCDALFYIGASPGADRERAQAEALGIPVYTKIEQVPV